MTDLKGIVSELRKGILLLLLGLLGIGCVIGMLVGGLGVLGIWVEGDDGYGPNPRLSELQNAQGVELIEAGVVERYYFRTGEGNVYECDSWSSRCRQALTEGNISDWMDRTQDEP